MDSPSLQRLHNILNIAKTQEGKKVFRCYAQALDKAGWVLSKYKSHSDWSVTVYRKDDRGVRERFIVDRPENFVDTIKRRIELEHERLKRESVPGHHIRQSLYRPLYEMDKRIRELESSMQEEESPTIRDAKYEAVSKLRELRTILEHSYGHQ